MAPYTGYEPVADTQFSCNVDEWHSRQSHKRTLGVPDCVSCAASPLIKDCVTEMSAIAERLFNSTDGDILSLSDVCIIQKGKQVNGEDLSETGKFYVMNGGVEPSGYYDQCNTPANTISISEGGNSCGYIQYNRDAFWSGGHCYTLNNIQPNIQKKDLEKFHILLTSKAIQESISAFLTTIDRKITNEDMLLQRFQKGKQYLLRQMFI